MRRIGGRLLIAAALLCAFAVPAAADNGDARRISNEPAATLLIPYFEAQVPKKIGDKPSGITTLVTVGNISNVAGLIHVTIWTDLGIPVLNFDLYMTGYDQVTFDLQEILNGTLPLSPGSPCLSSHILDTTTIQHVRAALTGNFSPVFNACAGLKYLDKKPIARGYITIDDVNQCTTLDISDPAYLTVIGTQNNWWGEYVVLNKSKKIRRSDAAVHVRAETNDSETLGPGQYTFYTRFEGIASSSFRQPLATTFFAPFDNVPKDKLYPQGTSLVVWRDVKASTVAPFACGSFPSWYPLDVDQVVAIDEQENVEDLTFFPPVPPAPDVPVLPFKAATQMVKLDTPSFPTTFTRGQLYLNLNSDVFGASGVPNERPGIMQNWVNVVRDNKNKYSVSTRAIHLDSATATTSVFLPVN